MVIVNYLFMCLIFGTTFLAIKIGVDSGLPPFLSAGFRFFVAGLILFTIMVWKRKAAIRLFFQKEMLITGICLTFGTFATLYWAEQYVTSGVAAVLSATAPMMILVLQSIILKQKENRLAWMGCLLGMIGLTLLLLPSLTIKTSSFWIYGCVAVIIGQVFYAAGTLYTKRVINKFQNISPIALNAVQMMHGGILLMFLSFVTETGQFDYHMSLASNFSLIYLIVFGSMIGHTLYYWLVVRTNPIFPSTWLFISPIIALILGVVFYEEYISWLTVIGTLTIITGTVLVNFQSIRGLGKKKQFFIRELKS
jgi:drug/metabolite transporter (DMT)-like permease